jgi:nitric oxide synthase-interacting protein
VESTPVEEDEKTRKEEPEPMCPSCKKRLSNSILMFGMSPSLTLSSNLVSDNHLPFIVVMKPCAHVTCKTCTDSLVRPAKQCVVCDAQLKEKDIVELKREGKRRLSNRFVLL